MNRNGVHAFDDDSDTGLVECGAVYADDPRLMELYPSDEERAKAIESGNRTREFEKKLKEDEDATKHGRLRVVNMADVTPRPVDWLWPNRWALGKLNLLVGEPGLGKTFTVIDATARLTTGRAWPDDIETPQPKRGVILMMGEDGLEDTIAPRLIAHGADMKMVRVIQGVEEVDHTGPRLFSFQRDLHLLEKLLTDDGKVGMIVADPLNAYIGSKIDSHKDADVRQVLQPLAALAERTGACVLGIMHLNKSTTTKALQRICGSGAYAAVARTVWGVAADDADPDRRLLVKVKINVGKAAPNLAFSIENGTVYWHAGTVDLTADEVMGGQVNGDDDGAGAVQEAMDFLKQVLVSGAVRTREVEEQAKDAGISKSALNRGRQRLKVKSECSSASGKVVWFMSLKPTPHALHERDERLEQHDHPSLSSLSSLSSNPIGGSGEQHAESDHHEGLPV